MPVRGIRVEHLQVHDPRDLDPAARPDPHRLLGAGMKAALDQSRDVAASEPLPVAGLDQGLGSALARAGIGWDVILFQKVRENSKAAALLAGEHVVIPEGNSSWFSCREGYEAIASNYASRLRKSLRPATCSSIIS